eukprot:COSAG05_NODE_9330_length_631_cov_1.483083_1_plen_88_part_00
MKQRVQVTYGISGCAVILPHVIPRSDEMAVARQLVPAFAPLAQKSLPGLGETRISYIRRWTPAGVGVNSSTISPSPIDVGLRPGASA